MESDTQDTVAVQLGAVLPIFSETRDGKMQRSVNRAWNQRNLFGGRIRFP